MTQEDVFTPSTISMEKLNFSQWF